MKIKEKKQVDALDSLKLKETKPVEYSNYFLKGSAEIRKNNPRINFNNLTYNFKGSENAPISFVEFKGPNHIFKDMHNGDIALEDVEKEQKELILDLSCIKQGNPKTKSPE